MIDNFALAVSHGLMMLVGFLLMRRADLDCEPSARDVKNGQSAPDPEGRPGA